jgi:hypothetical protein
MRQARSIRLWKACAAQTPKGALKARSLLFFFKAPGLRTYWAVQWADISPMRANYCDMVYNKNP